MPMLRKSLRRAALGLATVVALAGAPAARAIDGVNEINAASIIAAGGYPFMIGAPGSYVLTGNLTSGGPTALVIAAPNVVLDLNGFWIDGAGAAGPGIATLPVGVGLTVRNGTISGFGGPGILAGPDFKLLDTVIVGNGVGVAGASDCLVVENLIQANLAAGLVARRCKIENNVITDNGDTGIAGDQNVIVHNVIAANGLAGAGGGVFSFSGSTVQENQIIGNLGFGVSDTPGAPPGPVYAPPAVPFPVPPFPGLIPHVVSRNVIDGSTGGIGIYIATGATITDNTVTNNFMDGIVCGAACTLRGNIVSNNNAGLASNGGITVGPGSAVNGNSVSANTGIGAVLDPSAGYTHNTFSANTIQDMSVVVPAVPFLPHPTSGMFNLCSGVPGPAFGLCP
jgi:parallel beta-helix repeat protein